MRTCPYCDKAFTSNGSFRVHKYRFHKGAPPTQPERLDIPAMANDNVKPHILYKDNGKSVIQNGKLTRLCDICENSTAQNVIPDNASIAKISDKAENGEFYSYFIIGVVASFIIFVIWYFVSKTGDNAHSANANSGLPIHRMLENLRSRLSVNTGGRQP
jgi:hypothetical protein